MSLRSTIPLLTAAALAAFAGSCAAPSSQQATTPESSTPTPEAPQRVGPRLTALLDAAEKEASSPRKTDLPPPPYFDAAALTPFSPETGPDDARHASLDQALATFGTHTGAPDAGAASPPPTDEARRQALRLYTSGRMKLLRGNSSGAILDLESATRLDRTAAAPWRELAEAQIAQGKGLASMKSLEEAVNRGLLEPRALWLLGRDALRSGKTGEACRYLARSANSRPDQADPALRYFLYCDLGEALEKNGYSQAAAEAYSLGLDFPDQFSSSTRLRAEFPDFFRRRGDLWLRAGDLWSKLGDFEPAAAAYAESAAYAASDPDEAIVRQVYALQSLGRPASAAVAVLERIELQRGSAGDKMLALVHHLSKDPGTARLLRGAVDELAATIEPEAPATVRADLALLRSAAATPADASRILRDYLARHPSNAVVLARFFDDARHAKPGGDLVVLIDLVEQSPVFAAEYAAAALGAGLNADVALAALAERSNSDPHTLLLANIQSNLGRKEAAWELVSNRDWSPVYKGPGALARCAAASATGRWDEAQAAFDELHATHPEFPNRSRLLTAAASAMQRPDLALEVSPAPDTTNSVDELLDGARFCMMTGDAKGAEARLTKAVRIDPFDERAYALLLTLYGSDEPLADQAQLGAIARALRQAVPSSRTLRSVFAREMMQQSRDAQAEQMLLALADENITDADNGRSLIAIWELPAGGRTPAGPGAKPAPADPARLQRAEAWLRSRIESRPEVPWLWTGLARVLVAQNRPDDAEKLLAQRYEMRPLAEFAIFREWVLREKLGRVAEADALTTARVEPAPRSIDATIEYAHWLAIAKKPADALAALNAGLPPKVVLRDPQVLRLTLLMNDSGKVVEGTRGPASDPAWAQLFEAAASRSGARLAPQLHAMRISLLAKTEGVPPEQVLSAAAAAAAQYPALQSNFYLAAAAHYAESSQPRRALPFLTAAIKQSASPPGELMFETVRLIVLHGDAADARALVNEVTEPAKITALMTALRTDGPAPTDPVKLRAEFAYIIGNVFGSQSKDADANACYRLAIEIDSDHAWSLNNLGYSLVEKGGDLNEAARMLERAAVLLPQEANVLDSLGWLRYKQGIFEDRDSPDGKIEGAISLLRRAAHTTKGEANATVYSHLGDALWAANQRDEAAKAWEQAETLATTDISRMRSAQNPPTTAIETATKELDAIRARRKAVQENTEPPIEPRHASAPR